MSISTISLIMTGTNDWENLDNLYAAKNHTHSEYATTTDLSGKFDSANITYSNTDLTAGTSTLATGKYYFYYE